MRAFDRLHRNAASRFARLLSNVRWTRRAVSLRADLDLKHLGQDVMRVAGLTTPQPLVRT